MSAPKRSLGSDRPGTTDSLDPEGREPDPHPVLWFRENSIPITGLILFILFLSLIALYISLQTPGSRPKDFSDILKNFVEVAAIVSGGLWALFRFRKGRDFQESLIPLVRCRFGAIDNQVYLVVTTQIKNVGQSKIEFDQQGTALVLYEYKPSSQTELHTMAYERLTSFDILGEEDRYIEPNETIQTERIIALPGPSKFGYRVEAIVASDSQYTWRSATIADRIALSDNPEGWLIGL
jgi:hypothetical protein